MSLRLCLLGPPFARTTFSSPLQPLVISKIGRFGLMAPKLMRLWSNSITAHSSQEDHGVSADEAGAGEPELVLNILQPLKNGVTDKSQEARLKRWGEGKGR
eukprot:TRINITY_DN24399_c0_g1_i1.p1 TRINITY_DN24399_c0_g1~~TRINITY_DN24399_c0_g1_i1.p1  ORF type:complete len:101 (-),score=9.00 TRINITY_DN24399_c0_g1_i1:33-335(-)